MMGFTKKYADFIADRIGDSIAWLRANNVQYRELVANREKLIMQEINDLAECKQVMRDLNGVNSLIADIENSYLFLMGMQEQKNISDALTSPEFINELLHGNETD